MLSLNSVIQILLPLLYGSLVVCGAMFFFKQSVSLRAVYLLTLITAFVHAMYIGTYTVTTGHCLLTSASEIFSLIAFTLIATYIIVELRPSDSKAGTGLMVSIVAFFFQIFSSVWTKSVPVSKLNPIFLDTAFNIHVATSVFGYAALTLSTIYGSLYLLLYRAIKRNAFGAVFNRLPGLSRLERYGIRSLAVGFVFLSISIIFGVILIQKSFSSTEATEYLADPKTIATLLVWAVFGVTLLVHRVAHVEGRRLVMIWMGGYVLTVASTTIINTFGTEYHKFL